MPKILGHAPASPMARARGPNKQGFPELIRHAATVKLCTMTVDAVEEESLLAEEPTFPEVNHAMIARAISFR